MAKQQQADAAANAEAESQRVAEEERRAAEQAAADEQARKEREQTEVNAPLSDEVNKFGVPFVLSSDGTTTFGEVAVESGLKAAPIKLSLGENSVDDEGVNHGYGYLHIDAGHGQQILSPGTGFKSIEEFVETVARNYDTIREGNQVAGNQTYLLELSDEHNNTLFIQLSHDGSYWNVNSAGIFRKKYSRRMREVASLLTIGNSSSTETVEVNRGQKDGATATSENSSLTSEGKGSAENAAVQENGEKNNTGTANTTEGDEMADAEKAWEDAEGRHDGLDAAWQDRILDFIGEHYPTQASVTAETDSAKGRAEREAMLKDERYLELMRQRDFFSTLMRLLLKSIADLTGGKERSRMEMTDYMMAKHGLERNHVLAFRGAIDDDFADDLAARSDAVSRFVIRKYCIFLRPL